MHPADNVVVALSDFAPGTVIPLDGDAKSAATEGEPTPASELTVQTPVPFGHKLALRPIRRGEEVRKYGEVIGIASADIQAGEHVHVHNVESQRGRGDLAHSH